MTGVTSYSAALAPRALAIIGSVLALVLSGCTTTDGERRASPTPVPIETATSTEPPPEPSLDQFYDQKVRWEACGDGHRCASVKVPLDYADPQAMTLDISVLKVPATGERKLGSLVVNPGGPGVSGVQYAAQAESFFSPALRENFDIVGFDPRGVGRSNPVDCLSDQRLDEFVASDPDPDSPAEVRDAQAMLREFGQGCLELSGALARRVSTVEAARDIDILRAALGDRRLSWFGASYGTFLGATYADLFPKRVGRMVLDGAVDPSLDLVTRSLQQVQGFETALQAYLRGCVEGGDCPLGDDVDAAEKSLIALLGRIDAEPLPGDGERRLRIGNAVLGVWLPLYSKDYWPNLDDALAAALDGSGAQLLQLADAYVSRGPQGYLDNSNEAIMAINCLDFDDSIPVEEVPSYFDRFEAASPTFGRIFAWGLASCSEWPVDTGREPAAIRAAGAAPIMVLGTSRDPATPVEWARALAGQLESGVLVERDGDGHTAYLAGNDCVDDAVDSYLVSGKVPRGTVNC